MNKMGFGAIRSIVRPLSQAGARVLSPMKIAEASLALKPYAFSFSGPLIRQSPQILTSRFFHSLTDTRYPKRRPSDKPRRKRASLKPPGPYAWVKYVPGQPILPNQPNEGSVKGRKARKRMRQRRAFMRAEANKRKAQLREANKKKLEKRIGRKMAAVARERAWVQRLAELQKMEEEKKKSVT